MLKADFMSFNEVRQDFDDNVSGDGERDERRPPVKKNSSIKHKLLWHSRELQAVIEYLGRKIERCCTERSNSMWMCTQFIKFASYALWCAI